MTPPLIRTIDNPPSPLEALGIFSADPYPVLLHSCGADGQRDEAGRWSILCADPFETVTWSPPDGGDPFRRLVDRVDAFTTPPAGDLPFAGGAAGFIGYEASASVERIRPSTATRGGAGDAIPGLMFGLYSWGLIWDHRSGSCSCVATGFPLSGPGQTRRATDDLGRVMDRLRQARRSGPGEVVDPGRTVGNRTAPILSSSVPREDYLRSVEAARELIASGEIYQVNLSQQLELAGDSLPVDLFEAMTRISPAPFSAYLDLGETQILSASPERFLSLKRGVAESRPIKGTRPRGATHEEDARLVRELTTSAKDRAENVMIVDLVRNDLGRVCIPGSVRPLAICRPATYASVHHLVSVVTGRLDENKDRGDLLRALFPPGSMTGAPKVRAMQAIEDLEPRRRGVYSGSIGYLSFCGGMDLSVVIRTAIRSSGRIRLQVGGGVVADSDPREEYDESLDKARSVRLAIGAVSGTRSRRERRGSPPLPLEQPRRGRRTGRHPSVR